MRALGAVARAGTALGAARGLLGRIGADAVLAGGGYVAGPVGLAAVSRRTPLVLSEADSHLGLANRMLAPFARRVCLAFPIAGRDGDRYLVTGRPVPRAVADADRTAARARLGVPPHVPCVLVFGGSLGARSVNEATVAALGDGPAHVLHIAGARDFAEVRARSGERPGYRVIEYLDSLADPLAASDLVVARAGGSVFEIAAAGRPAILIPYPHATADHQAKNARWMADAGAAVVIPDEELDPARLRAQVEELLGDRERLQQMAQAARAAARPDAARSIAAEVLSAAGRQTAASEDRPWAARKLHFVGIGGAGMSGLALIARALGAQVSGCDAAQTPYFDELRAAGIDPQVGHDVAHAAADTELVVSTAIPAELPEVLAARRRGTAVHHRGELLAAAASMRRVIAVAGTHGKTTTTAMTAHALAGCGEAVGYAIGAELTSPGGGHRPNAVWGSGEWMAVEADESDRSFLNFEPEVAVLTNVELDHHSTYASELEVRRAFDDFLASVRASGAVVAWEGAGVAASVEFGLSDRAALRARDVRAIGAGMLFTLVVDGEDVTDVAVPVPGEHNVLNALAAIGAARAAGFDPARAARALESFQPAGRRFEAKGEVGGVRVFDDYAHHATEVAATLAAARALEPRRLVAVFQPHLYSRTAHTHADLGRALAEADVVVVLDVYRARERPEDYPGVSGALVARAAADHAGGREVWWLPTREEAVGVLAGRVVAGDLVVTLGAGDVDAVAAGLVRRLEGEQG